MNKTPGAYLDELLYEPGPIARWVAFGLGGAFGVYAAKAIFRKLSV